MKMAWHSVVLLMLLTAGKTVIGQQIVTQATPDEKVAVKTTLDRQYEVNKIVVQANGSYVSFLPQALPQDLDCKIIEELVSECIVLELPVITNLAKLSDDIAVMHGILDAGPLPVKHLIFFDLNRSKVVSWLAYFTDRSPEASRFMFDPKERRLVLHRRKNKIVGNSVYRIDREKATFARLAPTNGRMLDVSLGDVEEISPTQIDTEFFIFSLPQE